MEAKQINNMNTIKIEVSSTNRKEVEIELPYYSTNGCHFHKVFNADQCLSVMPVEWGATIGIGHSGLAFENGGQQCTKEEFEEAFFKSLVLVKEQAGL